MASHRTERLNSDMQRELYAVIRKLKDPRITDFISVMRVEVTTDLSYAKVFIGSINGGDDAANACKVLKGASGHIRSEISRLLHIRKAPELSFIPDSSAEYYEKISTLLKQTEDEE